MITDFFSIFNPESWMDEKNNALQRVEAIIFLLMDHP